eukprot:1160751-Pelagomonas_calceolata.AAC.4
MAYTKSQTDKAKDQGKPSKDPATQPIKVYVNPKCSHGSLFLTIEFLASSTDKNTPVTCLISCRYWQAFSKRNIPFKMPSMCHARSASFTSYCFT